MFNLNTKQNTKIVWMSKCWL